MEYYINNICIYLYILKTKVTSSVQCSCFSWSWWLIWHMTRVYPYMFAVKVGGFDGALVWSRTWCLEASSMPAPCFYGHCCRSRVSSVLCSQQSGLPCHLSNQVPEDRKSGFHEKHFNVFTRLLNIYLSTTFNIFPTS